MYGATQFTLAETESGFYLESIFPEYKGKIIPDLFKNFKSSPHTLHTKFSILPYQT